MYQGTTTGGEPLINPVQPAPHRCPNCGACPHCGRYLAPPVPLMPSYTWPYIGDWPMPNLSTNGVTCT